MEIGKNITVGASADQKQKSGDFLDAFSLNYAPGVYRVDRFRPPRQTFFATGVPAFLGTMVNAPSPTSILMLSLWSHFSLYVGTPYSKCNLAYAVRGFFENGGHW